LREPRASGEAETMIEQSGWEPSPELCLRTRDGIGLRARWLTTELGPRAVVVVAHGFSGHLEENSVQALATKLLAEGLDVLVYDARGHGGSDGRSGVGSTERLDVAAAVEEARFRKLPVILVGVSMGAVAVAKYLGDLAHEAHEAHEADGEWICGAVLVSAPARWKMRPSLLGLLTAAMTRTPPGRWIASRWLRVRISPRWRVGEPLVDVIKRVDLPLAIIHGTNDRLLSERQARLLHTSHNGPTRYDAVVGMKHGLDDLGQRAVISAVGWVFETQAPLRAEEPVVAAAY
jgi:uncharacterized protein